MKNEIAHKWGTLLVKVLVCVLIVFLCHRCERFFFPKDSVALTEYEHDEDIFTDAQGQSDRQVMETVPTEEIVQVYNKTPVPSKNRKKVFYWSYLISVIFLMWAWSVKGLNPESRPIMPRYTPPKGMTAAEAAGLYHRGVPKNIFAISISQMIVNGFVTLVPSVSKGFMSVISKEYSLLRTDKKPSNLEENLFGHKRVVLDWVSRDDLVQEERKTAIIVKSQIKEYYKTNCLWVIIPTGLLFWIFTRCFPEFVWSFGGIFALLFMNMYPFVSLRRMIVGYVGLWGCYVFLMLYLCVLSDGMPILSSGMGFGIMGITASVFAFLLRTPTEEGQRLIEHLEGLKMFLQATKSPLDERMKVEEKLTAEKMEKLFPYALALGVEEEWKVKFKKLFGATAYNTPICPNLPASSSIVEFCMDLESF